MADQEFQHNREEMARREVGHTDVGQGTAWVLALQFLAIVFCAPMSEVLFDRAETLGSRLSRLIDTAFIPAPPEGSLWSRIVTKNRTVVAELEGFEEGVEDTSVLGQSLRPGTQYALVRLGAGNEQAYPGRRPWLFFRESLDYFRLEAGISVMPEVVDDPAFEKALVERREGLDYIHGQEDVPVLERCQAGVRGSLAEQGYLSPEERSLWHFYNYLIPRVLEGIDGKRPVPA